jgi:serine protease AprX
MYKIKDAFSRRHRNLAATCSRRRARLAPGTSAGASAPKLKKMRPVNPKTLQRAVAVALAIFLGALPATAGLHVQRSQGVTMTGVDGVTMTGVDGVTMTGVDALLGLGVNNIRYDGVTMTGVDGVTMTGVDGVTMTGVDTARYAGPNTYRATYVNGVTMTGVDGVTMTGVDGVTMTGVDGTTWVVNSVIIRRADGVTMTGVDGVTMTGVDGFNQAASDGVTMTGVDGVTMTGVDSTRVNSAAQIVGVRPDGTVFEAPTNGVTMTGVDGVTMTGVDGVTMTGVDGVTMTGVDGVTMTGVDGVGVGLRGFDPELALLLDRFSDDSNVNAVVVYHRAVTEEDIATLQSIGVRGGTRFRALPMVTLSTTKQHLLEISRLPAVRSIYGNRTLQWSADTSRNQTGLVRMRHDNDLLNLRAIGPVQGAGVGVAILDTGLDSNHPDLSGRVIKNVKLADLQSANLLGFSAPTNVENLSTTDQASGHGTFVGGIVAGDGVRSSGKYRGYAPKARLVGLSAGDASLFNVLAGFDYLLSRPDLGVRVVNCSFSANTLYDTNDPINVATRLLFDSGVNIVFSAGNTGPGLNSLNPYAQAPWVISVGAVDARNRLADFSSRGAFASRNARPTLVAPGVGIVSLRATGTSLTSVGGVTAGDAELTAIELPYYTTASGTSFSAPQVAGTIALMLEANPNLTPIEVRNILQRTATPLPAYMAHEAGAGLLNTHAAVLEAAFPERRIGMFRGAIDFGQVRFMLDPLREFGGTVLPAGQYEAALSVPADAIYASAQIAWGPPTSTSDLGLAVYDPTGAVRAESNYLNLPGLTGKRERALLTEPVAGRWGVRVRHSLGLGLQSQSFRGVFETARAEYAPLGDLGGLDTATVADIKRALRTFTMWPEAGLFRPHRTLSRLDLAAAMVAAGRAPQYVPATPNFIDISDTTTMNFAESAAHLFPDAARGSAFRPDAQATRLAVAVVLVRAAGLKEEAESRTFAPTGFTDESAIPTQWRGYAATAVRHGLMSKTSRFAPNTGFTRAELARALAALARY